MPCAEQRRISKARARPVTRSVVATRAARATESQDPAAGTKRTEAELGHDAATAADIAAQAPPAKRQRRTSDSAAAAAVPVAALATTAPHGLVGTKRKPEDAPREESVPEQLPAKRPRGVSSANSGVCRNGRPKGEATADPAEEKPQLRAAKPKRAMAMPQHKTAKLQPMSSKPQPKSSKPQPQAVPSTAPLAVTEAKAPKSFARAAPTPLAAAMASAIGVTPAGPATTVAPPPRRLACAVSLSPPVALVNAALASPIKPQASASVSPKKDQEAPVAAPVAKIAPTKNQASSGSFARATSPTSSPPSPTAATAAPTSPTENQASVYLYSKKNQEAPTAFRATSIASPLVATLPRRTPNKVTPEPSIMDPLAVLEDDDHKSEAAENGTGGERLATRNGGESLKAFSASGPCHRLLFLALLLSTGVLMAVQTHPLTTLDVSMVLKADPSIFGRITEVPLRFDVIETAPRPNFLEALPSLGITEALPTVNLTEEAPALNLTETRPCLNLTESPPVPSFTEDPSSLTDSEVGEDGAGVCLVVSCSDGMSHHLASATNETVQAINSQTKDEEALRVTRVGKDQAPKLSRMHTTSSAQSLPKLVIGVMIIFTAVIVRIALRIWLGRKMRLQDIALTEGIVREFLRLNDDYFDEQTLRDLVRYHFFPPGTAESDYFSQAIWPIVYSNIRNDKSMWNLCDDSHEESWWKVY